MSVLGDLRWTAHEDIVLQRLASAGKYAAAIAVEMHRSEAAIRSHAALLNLTLAKKGQRGPKAKAKGETKPGPKTKSPKSKWYVSFRSNERVGKRSLPRATETFQNERDAKAFARAKSADCSNVNAGTLNPHMPKRTITSRQILAWLDEPEGEMADSGKAKGASE